MKKIFLAGVSMVAVVGAIFAFSTLSKAATNPTIELNNSQNTWSVEEGSDITLYFRIMPRELRNTSGIGFNGYENGKFTEYCYGGEDICGNYTIKDLKAGTYRLVYSVHNRDTAWSEQTKTLTVRPHRSASLSSVTLTQSGKAYSNTTGKEGLKLQAQARGSNIKTLKITRSDDSRKTISTSCTNMQSLCVLTSYPRFTSSDVGKTYVYEAVASDASGHTLFSEKMSIRVLSNAPTTTPNSNVLNPTLSLTPNVTRMNTTDAITLRGNVTNANGVWGMEVRALPSWTNVALKNRCILNNKPTNGSCSLNIGPFAGHAGETVKVWVIYWDAKTGLGYSSEMKTLTITRANDTDAPDADLTVAISAPRTISANERVTFTARTNIDDGKVIRSQVADTIHIYVNGRLVRTCTNVSSCSYVGGPFGQEITHRAERVSYYATAEYGNQFDSIPVQYSSIDYTN